MAEEARVAILEMQKGAPIVVAPVYAMTVVHYPYRKSNDLYVTIQDAPVKCTRPDCGAEFPIEGLVTHILKHDRRRPTLVAVQGLKPELVPELPLKIA